LPFTPTSWMGWHCRMFNRAIHTQALPKYLSSDHDPLYLFDQWQANLYVSLISRKSKQFLMPRCHIRSWRDLSEPSAENIWTKHYSGQPLIWRTNSDSSRIISIDSVFTLA
jgi:hypothetical protein